MQHGGFAALRPQQSHHADIDGAPGRSGEDDQRHRAVDPRALAATGSARRLPHHPAEQRVHPQVARDLRVERRRQHRALPHRHRPARRRAGVRARSASAAAPWPAPRPPAPAYSTHGARMNTARTGPPGRRRPAGPSRTSRPGGRTRCAAPRRPARRAAAGPAPVEDLARRAGSSRRTSRRRACRRRSARAAAPAGRTSSSSRLIVVDSPPGMHQRVDRVQLRRAAHRHGPQHRTPTRRRGARGRRPAAPARRSPGTTPPG